MVFRNFRFNVTIRIVALALSIALEMWLFTSTTFYITASLFVVLIVGQVVLLVRFVERMNGIITRFIQSATHGDNPSPASLQGRGKSFDDLFAAFAVMMDEFHKARGLIEEHFQSLQIVIQHIGFGLISFRRDGGIGFVNSAARRLLHTHHLDNVHALAALDMNLEKTLLRMQSGDKVLVKINREGEILQLAVHATEYRLGEHHYTLVSLQNIGAELDEKEMEAWHNLVRVLTHEIMNSITPIASLASTVNELLTSGASGKRGDLPPDSISDIRVAIRTIEKRSQGLLHFVDAYRHLTHIPSPVFQQCQVKDLLVRVQTLMRAQLDEARITWKATLAPDGLELSIDPDLIEQVLINLIRNAIQSMSGQDERNLTIVAGMDETGRVQIDVSDNGPGISAEIQPRIFIPFFSTKEDGSGIGLSLSRQIMRLHGGTITCRSQEGHGTTFVLKF